MENLLRDFLPYLFILYLADCVTYIKGNHILFVSYWGKSFRIKGPGLHFVGICPVDRAFVSDDLPFIFTPEGIFVVESRRHSRLYRDHDFLFVPYDSIDKVVVGGNVTKLNDSVSLTTSSSIRAKHTARFIYDLKNTTAVKRGEKIESAETSAADIIRVEKRSESHEDAFLLLRLFCSALFGCIFFILPAILYLNLLLVFLPFVVAAMLLTYFIILSLVVYLHQKIFPGDKSHLVNALTSMVLLPVSSTHAQIYLCRDMFSGFDKVTLASKYLSSAKFRELIGKEIQIAEYSKELSDNDSLKNFWNRRATFLNRVLASKGISKMQLFPTPEQHDPTASSYCPLCESEYRSGFVSCADCGIGLEKFSCGEKWRGESTTIMSTA